ncbi:MAG: polymorphic toxin-type HINT domain-containing protein [Kineosporiaceae bacterium]
MSRVPPSDQLGEDPCPGPRAGSPYPSCSPSRRADSHLQRAPRARGGPPRRPLPPGPLAAAPAPPGGAATLAHDALGRLVGVVASTGAVSRYSYDAAGNVTAVTSLGTPAVAVLAAVPAVVRRGASLTVTGKGFSTTPSANTVTLNGAAATVSSASATQLVVTVPASATSGTLSVTTAAGSATYPGVTVSTDAAPAITAFTPTLVAPGSTVTVTASGTVPTLADNALRANQSFLTLASRSTTGLTATVPLTAGSGPLRLDTPAGGTTTSGLLYVAPGGTPVADIASTGTLTVGTTTSVAVPAGKAVLRAIPTTQGARYAVTGSSALPPCTAQATLFDAKAQQQRQDTCLVSGAGLWMEPLTSDEGGYLSLLLRNTGTADGTVSVTVLAVPDDVAAGTLSLDGTALTLATTAPGQLATARISGVAGRRLLLQGSTASTSIGCCGATLRLTAPDGTQLAASTTTGDTLGPLTLPATGTYTVTFDPTDDKTGSAAVQAWDVQPDVDAGVLPLDGTARTFATTSPGQVAVATFAGSAGQRISLQGGSPSAAIGCCNARLTLTAPDGTAVPGGSAFATVFLEPVTLPVTGTYRLTFDPTGILAGSTAVSAWTVPADVATGPLPLDGTLRTLRVTAPGQKADATLSAAAGTTLTVTVAGATCCSLGVSLINPAGTGVATRVDNGALTTAVTTAGTYRVRLDPTGAAIGSVTVSARAVATPAAHGDEVPAGDAALARAAAAHRPQAPGAGPAAATTAWSPDHANLDGADWVTRRADVTDPPPLTAPKGVTAVSGLVRDLDGSPLKGVTVSAGTSRQVTDAQGRFLITGVAPAHTVVVVDGAGASSQGRRYGLFRIRAQVREGLTTPLEQTVWLTRLDTRHTVRLDVPSTTETVLTTPDIPGLEVRIPAGSVVRDARGRVVRELGITAVPLDRAPYPLPRNTAVPVFFTVQPGGGAIFPDGARVVYPNYTQLAPGTRVDFWNYDPETVGWHVYGHGTVTADGRQVVPDARTKLWKLDGAMFSTGLVHTTNWLVDALNWLSGDPVHLATGLMVDSHTDLAVDDVIPIAATRVLWTGDGFARDHGLNWANSYDLTWANQVDFQEVDLSLPDGGLVHFTRTSPGTGRFDAVLAAKDAPEPWRGAVVRHNPAWVGWDLTLRDGTVYEIPAFGKLRAIRDRFGNRVVLTRTDPGGPLREIASPSGRTLTFTRDAAGRFASVQDNAGRKVSYTYDSLGRLSTVTDPAGKVTTYTWDPVAWQRLVSVTNARGVTTMTVAYDAKGRVVKQTLAGGAVYSFAYTVDAAGKVTRTSVTAPSGAVRSVAFDARGRATSVTDADGTPLAATTSFTRDAAGRVVSVVDPAGRRTETAYDSLGRPTQTTVLAGTSGARVVEKATWTALDQPATVTDAAGATTTYGYDARGALTSVRDPAGRTATFTVGARGQVRSMTAPLGRTTTFTYAGTDLVGVTDAAGRTTRRFVDAAGRVSATTDALGATTRLALDARNDLTSVVDPLGGTVSMAYDANGNRTSLTDQRGKVRSWTYDGADRPITMTDPLGRTASIGYDAAGRTVSTTTWAGLRTTTAYDALDRVTATRFGVTATGQQSQITRTYAANGLPATITDSAGGTVAFAYSPYDQLTSVTTSAGTVTYGYDAVGRRTSTTNPGKPATTYAWTAAGQLASVTRGSVSASLTYDAAGRPATVTLPGGWAQTYAYDAVDQVTGITYAQGGTTRGTLAYGYDRGGRRSSVSGTLASVVPPAARSGLVYDAANRLTGNGSATLTYDADGNLTGDGTSTYTWDARGQLAKVVSGGRTTTFAYDATGARRRRTVTGTASSDTGFLLDGENVGAELSGTTVTGELLSGGLDTWFARTTSAGTEAVLTDASGSPVGTGAADGTFGARWAFDPYGKPSTTGDLRGGDLSFTGRQDDGTGLLYYRARYYSPTLQRFISEDPLGLDGGTNGYAYAADSPMTLDDPMGTNPMLAGCLIGGLSGAAMDWAGQRLSGSKVNWGMDGVGGAALSGCAMGALTGLLGELGGLGTAARACSFAASTPVLLADGTTKPIADVRAGDRVLATDPETGEQGGRAVREVFAHEDTLVDLELDDGTVLTTTADHPFWSVTDRRFERADELDADEEVLTASGARVGVRGLRPATEPRGTAYNLSVEGIHTYHVGTDRVLVHNSCRPPEIAARFGSYLEARGDAMARAGLGADRVPFVQKLGPQAGRITGMQSPDRLRGWRIDFAPDDPAKGFHVNWWVKGTLRDSRTWVTGANIIKGGTLDDFQAILAHFPHP